MKINNASNINNTPSSFGRGEPKLWTINSDKVKNAFQKMGNFSTPQNRLFMGASALALQPMIDWNNKDVDEKTRQVSVARTIAKIGIGTVTGIVVRQQCINLMKKFTYTLNDIEKLPKEKEAPKLAKLFIPNHISEELFQKAERLMKKHRNALGSIMALGVMLFTNFLVDAPLTRIFTNGLIDEFKQNNMQYSDTKADTKADTKTDEGGGK